MLRGRFCLFTILDISAVIKRQKNFVKDVISLRNREIFFFFHSVQNYEIIRSTTYSLGMQASGETKRKKDSSEEQSTSKKQKFDFQSRVYDRYPCRGGVPNHIQIPLPGVPVDRKKCRQAGPYTIGAELIGVRPLRGIIQYLGKKEDTNEFVQLKILQLSTGNKEGDTVDERQGKILLHTEHSLLTLLQHEEGIVRQHGMFSDFAYEESQHDKMNPTYTGVVKKRLILVLDCLIQHPYCDKSSSYVSLQEYIMTKKKLTEPEALFIFYQIVKIVESIHDKNIVHRDLKLGNIVLNKTSKKIIITNFCLGRYVSNENTLLHDQQGSPAYISPDVICGNPYKGKPSDMWAVGVIYFIMLFGNFPFFKSTSGELFAQIQSGKYELPFNCEISLHSTTILKRLLEVNPNKRCTAKEMRHYLGAINFIRPVKCIDQQVPSIVEKKTHFLNAQTCLMRKEDQVVPTCARIEEKVLTDKTTSSKEDGKVPIKLSSHNKSEENLQSLFRPKQTVRDLRTTQSLQSLGTRIENNFSQRCYSLAQTMDDIRNIVPRHAAFLQLSSTVIPSRSSPNGNYTLGSIILQPTSEFMIRGFLALLNRSFTSTTAVVSANGPLLEFNGILSSNIASRLKRWLLEEFGQNQFVRQTLTESNESTVTKVRLLLMRCGVQMEISMFGPRISRQQPAHVLIILSYLLKATGFSNSYFEQITPS